MAAILQSSPVSTRSASSPPALATFRRENVFKIGDESNIRVQERFLYKKQRIMLMGRIMGEFLITHHGRGGRRADMQPLGTGRMSWKQWEDGAWGNMIEPTRLWGRNGIRLCGCERIFCRLPRRTFVPAASGQP